jgi:hypothetical protein
MESAAWSGEVISLTVEHTIADLDRATVGAGVTGGPIGGKRGSCGTTKREREKQNWAPRCLDVFELLKHSFERL